jgi:hypothetical protein
MGLEDPDYWVSSQNEPNTVYFTVATTPTTLIITAIGRVAVVAVVSLSLLVHFKKRNRKC